MGNYRDIESNFPGRVDLMGKVVIGAGGAVSSYDIDGVESVTRNGTGDYTFKLKRVYYALKNWRVGVEKTTAVGLKAQLHSETVQTAATRAVRLLVTDNNSPANASDPSSSTLWVHLVLKDSSAG